MSIPAEYMKELAAFPDALRRLIGAELAAGNTIVELSSCFPAPPAGAYVLLAKHVTTRPRESGDGLDFYDRNSSSYSGEFTDEKRFYFVLEPPNPPEPEPNMDEIRARANLQTVTEESIREANRPAAIFSSMMSAFPRPSGSALSRFEQSMVMDYEKWREGTSYDLAILKTASPEELVAIEELLLRNGTRDWRDVEALAALDSPRARVALRAALKSLDSRVRTAVADYAPHLISDKERADALVKAIEGADTYGGLTQALLQIEEFHPKAVIDALFRAVLARDGGPPVHFAAMLMFLHGKAKCAFDWEQRPFFLKFRTEERAEREALFRELCEKIGVKPEKYLRRKKSR